MNKVLVVHLNMINLSLKLIYNHIHKKNPQTYPKAWCFWYINFGCPVKKSYENHSRYRYVNVCKSSSYRKKLSCTNFLIEIFLQSWFVKHFFRNQTFSFIYLNILINVTHLTRYMNTLQKENYLLFDTILRVNWIVFEVFREILILKRGQKVCKFLENSASTIFLQIIRNLSMLFYSHIWLCNIVLYWPNETGIVNQLTLSNY